MKQPRKFEDILNKCLERMLVEGDSIEQCLRRFPEQAEALEPLLETARATRQAAAIQPRPELKDKLRRQLDLSLQKIERKKSYPIIGWQPRWATVIALVLVLVLASSGTVVAASGSMPGEPLYPVKLASEQVQLALTPSTASKAEFYTELADRRVNEIVHMAGISEPEQIEQATQRLDSYLAKIATLSSTDELTNVVETTPRPRIEEALSPERGMMNGKRAHMNSERWSRVRTMMGRHATDQPERLRAALKTAPASARPALLRAIAISEAGYKRALKSLGQP